MQEAGPGDVVDVVRGLHRGKRGTLKRCCSNIVSLSTVLWWVQLDGEEAELRIVSARDISVIK